MLQQFGLPRLKGNEAFLAVLLIDALGTGLYLPFTLLYFQNAAGLELAVVGPILSLAAIIALPFAPLTGIWVDRYGARRTVMAAQLLQGLGFLGFLAVRTPLALLLIAPLVAVGQRMFWSSFFTLVAQIAPAEERDRWYGLTGAAQNLGLGLGGLLSGLIVASEGVTGYRLLVGINALSFLVAAILLTRVRASPRSTGDASPAGFGALLRDRPFGGLTLVNVLFALCGMMLSVGLPVFAAEALDVAPWVPGSLFAFNTALIAFTQTLAVRFLEPYRRTRALALAGLVFCLWSLLTAFALAVPPVWLVPYLFVSAAWFTLAEVITAPTANALAAAASPEAQRGRYLAVYQLSFAVAGVIAPGFFTLLFTQHAAAPWVVIALVALGASAAMVRLEAFLPRSALKRA